MSSDEQEEIFGAELTTSSENTKTTEEILAEKEEFERQKLESEEKYGKFARQAGLVPPELLQRSSATIVGVGAIGRQVALQLAAVGVPELTLVDFDTVEHTNVVSQGYFELDLGRPKVEATKQLIGLVAPQCICNARNERFSIPVNSSVDVIYPDFRSRSDASDFNCSAIFLCVDSMESREFVFEKTPNFNYTNVEPSEPQSGNVPIVIDGRMAAETIRVISYVCGNPDYRTTLFDDSQAFVGSCTTQNTIYTANIAAGLMVQRFVNRLRMNSLKSPMSPEMTDILLSLNDFSIVDMLSPKQEAVFGAG